MLKFYIMIEFNFSIVYPKKILFKSIKKESFRIRIHTFMLICIL